MSMHSDNLEALNYFRSRWAKEGRTALVKQCDEEIARVKRIHSEWLARVSK